MHQFVHQILDTRLWRSLRGLQLRLEYLRLLSTLALKLLIFIILNRFDLERQWLILFKNVSLYGCLWRQLANLPCFKIISTILWTFFRQALIRLQQIRNIVSNRFPTFGTYYTIFLNFYFFLLFFLQKFCLLRF